MIVILILTFFIAFAKQHIAFFKSKLINVCKTGAPL